MSTRTYTATDINGNEVVLSASSAEQLYHTLDREYHKEDVLSELSSLFDDTSQTVIDASGVSDDLVEAIVDTYEKWLADDEGWHDVLRDAVNEHKDAIREELCSKSKTKSGKDLNAERE